MLIDPCNPKYRLDIASMDLTHLEFIELVNALGSADKQGFIELFDRLLVHTQAHFEAENQLMHESGFPAIGEHKAEHERILGDMHRMGARVSLGNTLIPRAFIKDHIPSWFELHAQTMDSALAAHIKNLNQHKIQIET
ncbi:MAG: hemerythrin domain-containing protein [Sedimenticola sp.]